MPAVRNLQTGGEERTINCGRYDTADRRWRCTAENLSCSCKDCNRATKAHCRHSYKNKGDLEDHVRSHHGDGTGLACTYGCGTGGFQNKSNARRHEKSCSLNLGQAGLTCAECGARHSRSDNLRRHLISRHQLTAAAAGTAVQLARSHQGGSAPVEDSLLLAASFDTFDTRFEAQNVAPQDNFFEPQPEATWSAAEVEAMSSQMESFLTQFDFTGAEIDTLLAEASFDHQAPTNPPVDNVGGVVMPDMTTSSCPESQESSPFNFMVEGRDAFLPMFGNVEEFAPLASSCPVHHEWQDYSAPDMQHKSEEEVDMFDFFSLGAASNDWDVPSSSTDDY